MSVSGAIFSRSCRAMPRDFGRWRCRRRHREDQLRDGKAVLRRVGGEIHGERRTREMTDHRDPRPSGLASLSEATSSRAAFTSAPAMAGRRTVGAVHFLEARKQHQPALPGEVIDPRAIGCGFVAPHHAGTRRRGARLWGGTGRVEGEGWRARAAEGALDDGGLAIPDAARSLVGWLGGAAAWAVAATASSPAASVARRILRRMAVSGTGTSRPAQTGGGPITDSAPMAMERRLTSSRDCRVIRHSIPHLFRSDPSRDRTRAMRLSGNSTGSCRNSLASPRRSRPRSTHPRRGIPGVAVVRRGFSATIFMGIIWQRGSLLTAARCGGEPRTRDRIESFKPPGDSGRSGLLLKLAVGADHLGSACRRRLARSLLNPFQDVLGAARAWG